MMFAVMFEDDDSLAHMRPKHMPDHLAFLETFETFLVQIHPVFHVLIWICILFELFILEAVLCGRL